MSQRYGLYRLPFLTKEATPCLRYSGLLKKLSALVNATKNTLTVASGEHQNYIDVMKNVPVCNDNVTTIIELRAVQEVSVYLLIVNR